MTVTQGSEVRSPRPTGLAPVSLPAVVDACQAPIDMPHSRGVAKHAVGITGVTLRSGDVRPGDLFVALAGSTAHGASFAQQAIRAGAEAVLTDPVGYDMMRDTAEATAIPILVTERPRAIVGAAAAAVYHQPSQALRVIGVTGTSGKTTTCYLLEAALAAAGRRVGLIGTVGARIDGQPVPSALTTPEAPDLQALFAVMLQRGVDTVAMEVSSHALALGRVDGTRFDVGAFTNLSQDHLDFHGDMQHYFAAKKLLFDGRARAEVVVVDDDYGRQLAADRPGAVTVSGRANGAADWTVHATPGAAGIQQLDVTGPGLPPITASIALPGSFNVTNALTALACVHAAGFDPSAAAAGLAAVHVPGRMQRVEAGQPFLALVDYAHKPAALKSALAAVRGHCDGRILVVFGAGGDRDHGKRPMMGAIAAEAAEVVIVTDDNPRSEDPAAIRQQIVAGARGASSGADIREIGDRRAAILAAVQSARPGDAVLIAGKGHEQGQDIGGVMHHFSDVEELTAAVSAWAGGSAATP